MKKQLILAVLLIVASMGIAKASQQQNGCTLPAVGLFKVLNRTGTELLVNTSSGFCCCLPGKSNYVIVKPDEEYWIKKPILHSVKFKLPVNGAPHARMAQEIRHYPSSKAFWLVVTKGNDYRAATGTALQVTEQATSWKCGGKRFIDLPATK